ncbi:MAG: hypothetical protein JWO27_850 [Frankiales bacterium]|nr:hypothetical protein [Frankiales bacterium]MCW2709266.1 hypothetical protein [Frankiales bacterium]
MRLRSVRVARLLAVALLAASCQGQPLGRCGGKSCPPPAVPQVKTVLTVDGETYRNFRVVHRLSGLRTHDMAVTVTVEPGAHITHYRFGEAGSSYGTGPYGEIGIRHLTTDAGAVASGTTLHVRWRPHLTGLRGLLLVYTVVPPAGSHEQGGEIMSSVGDFQVYDGTELRVIADCTHAMAKPTSLLVACGDGSLRLSQMRYDSWSRVAAYGHGVVIANDFKPDRARGHDRSYRVDFRLSHVREFADGPHFTTLRVTYLSGSPHGSPVETFPV